MVCTFCGFHNDADAEFCENCGKALEHPCPNCGNPVKPGARFCKKCGALLTGLQPDRAYEERLAKLQQSAPAELKEKIRLSSSRMEGERKPVTILFTDIVGSTALAEKLDPEEWKEIVSAAHQRISQAVYRYEGTIAQLLGDGVLAFFGAPVTHEDDPIRAVHAALDIQQSIGEYAAELKGYVDQFQIRIGLNSGTVVVGSVGSDLHMEYLAIGDAVNLAARLQTAARPGGILISESTAKQVRAIFDLQSLGEISLKGKAEPVSAFEVLHRKAVPEGSRGFAELSSPLVGRQTELASLQSILARLEHGQGGIVFIFGEAGIGKSRLLEEARCTTSAKIRWLEGRSLSYGGALPYWTVIQLILQDLELSDGDPAARIRVALSRRLEQNLAGRRSEFAPYLYHLIGLQPASEAERKLTNMSAEALKRQVLVSVAAYISALVEKSPLVLVFEDLHWADASSLDVLERLFPLTERYPLLLVCLARPEREHGSWRLKQDALVDFPAQVKEIHLKGLSANESGDLVDGFLERAELPEEVHKQILDRAEGNPLYIEEILGNLIDQGTLIHADAGWQVTGQAAQFEIPDTLHGVLLARIDNLAEDVRHTLQQASVIGRSFLYRLLQAISDAEAELDWHLAQLQRLDLVREKARLPELEYIFKHSLIQEAAYTSLLIERRHEFHRRVAKAMESLFADRIEEFYGFLAHHYELAGEELTAIGYYLKAGDKARLENAIQEARDMYEKAISLLEASGDWEATAPIWLKLGLTQQLVFEFEQAHLAYEKAFNLQRQARMNKPLTRVFARPGDGRAILRAGKIYSYLDKGIELDPFRIVSTVMWEIVPQLFAALGKYDFEANLVPHIARSWEILEDGLRYVFHLRDDVHWTDGKPITAADFEWSWKHLLVPGNPPYPAMMLDDVLGARPYRLGENPDPDRVGVHALDELTLEVLLEKPVPYFIYLTACQPGMPLPSHIVPRFGEDWWKPEHGVYSGPFRLTEYAPNRLRFEKNPLYFDDFPGNLDEIVMEFTHYNDRTLVKRFLNEELDIIFNFPLYDPAQTIPSKFQNRRCGLTTNFLTFNPTKPPLDDPRVRRALVQGLDFRHIEELISMPYGVYQGGGLVPPGMAGYSPELGLPFDLKLARNLLAEAGYPGGKGFPVLKYFFIEESLGLEKLVRHLKEDLGIECEVLVDSSGMVEPSLKDANFLFSCWIADYPDPDSFLRNLPSSEGGLKETGWKNMHYDQLIEEAGKCVDQKRRMELYRQADRIITNEEVVIMPLSYGTSPLMELIHPWVSGIQRDISTMLHYDAFRLERDRGKPNT
jgi:ABC-type oligopeptide transport system substrate-binding subunit/class 3 adenylate cyclase/ABC-type lipoprotein export system ATPase subunit